MAGRQDEKGVAPINREKLQTAAEREAALDALGEWFAETLASADDAAARMIIRGAISAFYDVREAAGQERGQYAGHFFLADAVGLESTGRSVPWTILRGLVSDERLERLEEVFAEVGGEVE